MKNVDNIGFIDGVVGIRDIIRAAGIITTHKFLASEILPVSLADL